MYIEISARTSGKTRRMIEAVNEHLKEHWANVAVIVARSKDEARLLKSRVCSESRVDARVRCADGMLPLKLQPFDCFNKIKFFVHEFEDIDPRRLMIDANSYYVTSLKRRRKPGEKDFLTQLVEFNNGKYSSYGFCGDYKELMDRIGYNAFKRETVAEWQTPDRQPQNREMIERLFETARFTHNSENDHPEEMPPFLKSFENFLIEKPVRACGDANIYLACEND